MQTIKLVTREIDAFCPSTIGKWWIFLVNRSIGISLVNAMNKSIQSNSIELKVGNVLFYPENFLTNNCTDMILLKQSSAMNERYRQTMA